MEPFVTLVKYLFVAGLVVEVALMIRALILLARDKSRSAALAEAPVQTAEE